MPKSGKIALITVFTALTIGLNLSPIKIPAPHAPFLIYQVWEVPIVAAFLLYGFSVSVLISIVNTLVLLAIFPGVLLTGPLYNLAAIISMLLGLLFSKFLMRTAIRCFQEFKLKSSLILIVFGIIFRVVIMTLVNWAFLRFPPPIGFSLTEEAISLSLPLIAFFNATLAFYTILLGYIIAEAVKTRIKIYYT
ncbi:MAG: hypothetical protein QXG34_00975 [Candidatus Bathyarchaeia archaeon]